MDDQANLAQFDFDAMKNKVAEGAEKAKEKVVEIKDKAVDAIVGAVSDTAKKPMDPKDVMGVVEHIDASTKEI